MNSNQIDREAAGKLVSQFAAKTDDLATEEVLSDPILGFHALAASGSKDTGVQVHGDEELTTSGKELIFFWITILVLTAKTDCEVDLVMEDAPALPDELEERIKPFEMGNRSVPMHTQDQHRNMRCSLAKPFEQLAKNDKVLIMFPVPAIGMIVQFRKVTSVRKRTIYTRKASPFFTYTADDMLGELNVRQLQTRAQKAFAA